MKNTIIFLTSLVFLLPVAAEFCGDETSLLIAQEKKEFITDKSNKITQSPTIPNAPQVTGDTVTVKDDAGNVLITITDEGSAGSIKLNNAGAVTPSANKLYNNSGTLYWNGSALGSSGVTEINDLSDAKNDNSSLFLGFAAGQNDDGTNNSNTATGTRALLDNTVGFYNTAIGYQSMNSNIDGSRNTAIGHNSLKVNTSGSYNTATGHQSLMNNISSYNTANGNLALYSNTYGSRNTAIGYKSLVDNISGSYNTATGYLSLSSTTGGNYNTATGFESLSSNDGGDANTATGYQSLASGTSGSYNTATGYKSLYSNSGGANTAIGYQSLHDNGNGFYNTATGYSSIKSNTTGQHNTGIGYKSLYNNTSGSNNVGIGTSVNTSNRQGSNNTIIGFEAGKGTGSNDKNGSIFLGYQAGYNETSDDKLYIENSNSSTPLIWGDFANNLASIHGKLGISTKAATSKIDIDGSNGYDQLRMRASYTPTGTADANGEIGDTAWNDDYFYIKTNAGWKRTVLSTF